MVLLAIGAGVDWSSVESSASSWVAGVVASKRRRLGYTGLAGVGADERAVGQ